LKKESDFYKMTELEKREKERKFGQFVKKYQDKFKGKYDLLVKNPDGTYTVVDFKISKPGEDKIDKYKTQLGAYKFALENPKDDDPIKISRLALLILFPNKTHFDNGAILHFPHTWLDIPIDNAGFLKFMKEVDSILSGLEPEVSETCKWCLYRKCYKP